MIKINKKIERNIAKKIPAERFWWKNFVNDENSFDDDVGINCDEFSMNFDCWSTWIGIYSRGFRSSETKQDRDDEECDEHVHKRRGGGAGIIGGGGGK